MKDGLRSRYTLEFKQEAVRLVRGGEKISAVARTLGVGKDEVRGGSAKLHSGISGFSV